jgi:hypothetical protein
MNYDFKVLIDTPKPMLEYGEKLAELSCALHHLKHAIAAVEICGVPIHHLSHDIGKHFEVHTVDFVKEIQAKAVEDFCKSLRRGMAEKEPKNCSQQMIEYWKSAMVDCRSYGDIYSENIRKGGEA